MQIQQAIQRVIERQDLNTEQMTTVMRQIMCGEATSAQIGGFLVALRMKGETIDEVEGAVRVMRELASSVEVSAKPLVDTCGTGGDGADLFNVSTAGAFVVAAAGAHVAKHGNRSVSSSTGSADVLEAAGIRLDLTPEQVAQCIEKVGVGFMFAPAHHSAMKHAIGPRKELATRTIFNMLGPMTNPAGVKRQVIGVFDAALCQPMAEVLARLGSEHVMVVHAEDGLDEISISAPTYVAELKNGQVKTYTMTPSDYGVDYQDLSGLSVDSAADSLTLIEMAFSTSNELIAQKARAIIALNAGAAIYVAGLVESYQEGVEKAQALMASGEAKAKLSALKAASQEFDG